MNDVQLINTQRTSHTKPNTCLITLNLSNHSKYTLEISLKEREK